MPLLTLAEKVERLRNCPLFASLPYDALRMLSVTGALVTCPADDVLFHQGEEHSEAYVLLEGTAEAVVEVKPGRTVVLSRFGPSDIVGEFAAIAEVPRSATIHVLTPLTALRISRTNMLELFAAFPMVSLEIMRVLVHRLLTVQNRFLAMAAEGEEPAGGR